MDDEFAIALKQNYVFFQGVVHDLMKEFAGQYALVRDRAVVEIFSKPADALEAGSVQFDDGLFSVQMINDRPRDLGFLSYAAGDGDAD